MTPANHIKMASGRSFLLPLFDPVVAKHFANPNSNVAVLLDQINREEIYAPLFKGKTDLTFLDIGANIGLVSLYAADSCRRIVALEPAPDTYSVLKAMTVKLPQIEIAEFALAPKEAEIEFFVNSKNTTASSSVNTYGDLIKVQGLKLSDILRIYQLEHVDIIKCDAEGSEGESLTFDELKLAEPVVDAFWIETHNCPKTDWQHKLGTLVSYFARLGYSRMEVNGMALWARKKE